MLTFLRLMAFMTEFEVAITPHSAKHYSRLVVDAHYWRGEANKYRVSKMYLLK